MRRPGMVVHTSDSVHVSISMPMVRMEAHRLASPEYRVQQV